MPEPTISSEVLDDSGRVLVRTSDGTPFYLPLAVLLGKNGYWLQPNADGSINVISLVNGAPLSSANPVPAAGVGTAGTPSGGVVSTQNVALDPGDDQTFNRKNVENKNTFRHIAAGQATTIVKAGHAYLHSITFNTKATASNVTTVYNDPAASGDVVAIPDAPNIAAGTTVVYDVDCPLGIVVITGTANGADMTVSYT